MGADFAAVNEEREMHNASPFLKPRCGQSARKRLSFNTHTSHIIALVRPAAEPPWSNKADARFHPPDAAFRYHFAPLQKDYSFFCR